jgi:hypothetical protein
MTWFISRRLASVVNLLNTKIDTDVVIEILCSVRNIKRRAESRNAKPNCHLIIFSLISRSG